MNDAAPAIPADSQLKRDMPLVPANSIAGRALVVVIAILTFLACLTAGGAILVGEASQAWRGDVSRDVTIQIKPRAGEDADAVVAAAAEIANGYIDEFRKLSANLAITEASQRRIFFQQQLKEAKENLAAAEEAMKGTEQSTGVFQIDSQTRVLIESAAALRAQIVAKEVQIQGMRSYATEDNPEIFEAKQQLAALQAQLARLADADQDSSSGLIVPKGKVPEAGMEYIRKLRDVKYYDTISELIAKQFEMAKLDEARQGAVIQVVDVAVPPDHRSYPKRTITVILAMVLAFFVACGWGILAESLRRLDSNPAERQRLDALRATFRRPKTLP